jgi:hypothetical protein
MGMTALIMGIKSPVRSAYAVADPDGKILGSKPSSAVKSLEYKKTKTGMTTIKANIIEGITKRFA